MTSIRRFAKATMGRLSTKLRVSIGLVLLLLSLIMGLMYIGLVPDERQMIREARANLAEALSANVTALIGLTDSERLATVLEFVVERNADLLSLAVRRADGESMVQVGEHEGNWRELSGGHSTDTQVQVPIWSGAQKWGQVELRFKDPRWLAGIGVDIHPQVLLMLVIGVVSTLVFYLYLSRTLRHLDPSKAVPPRVRAALDTMAEGLMVVDLDGFIVLVNQALAGIFGKEPDDIIGDSATAYAWTDADGERYPAEALPWVRALREKRMLVNLRVRLATADGVVRSFNVNCSPVLGDGDRHGGVLVSFDDVTVLEQKEFELRESRDAAEAANRAKSVFLANMSHEIRTPMNAILGFTEVLRRGYDRGSQEWKSHLGTIHSSGKHLLELINDILDLSKVESGKLEVERLETHPHQIIAEVVKVLGVKAREKGIALDLRAASPVPERIVTDPGRLRQIVTNLVGNAIKFTESGGVEVAMRVDTLAGHQVYVIDVADTGVGMAPDALDKIFNAFEQADTSVTRRFGGTGLGLSISKRFAEALGGDITVRSTPGEGSVFTVSLDPGTLKGVRMLQPEELHLQGPDLEQDTRPIWRFPDTRALVVDDGPQNRALVRLVLEESDIRVEEAENGQIAVEKAVLGSFDVILMDINMPVMDGYTALKLMREQGIEAPVLALTADVMEGVADRMLAAGFSGYVGKPIDFDVMLDTLAEYTGAVRISGDPDAEVEEPTRGPTSSATRSAVAGPPIVSRLPVKDPRFRVIVEEFIDQLGEKMAAIERAWEARNYEALRAAAHYLKGAGGSVGFDAFTAPAKRLEQLAKQQSAAGADEAIAELRDLALRVVIEAGPGTAEPAGSLPVEQVESPVRAPIFSRLNTADPRFRAIVEEFIAQLDAQIVTIRNAWETRDYEALRAAAHYLKGAGGSVGFDAFTGPAAHLEKLARLQHPDGIAEAIQILVELASRVVVEDGAAMRRPQAV